MKRTALNLTIIFCKFLKQNKEITTKQVQNFAHHAPDVFSKFLWFKLQKTATTTQIFLTTYR